MCGHFGVFYKKATSKKLPSSAIKLAIYLTQLRGIHGLGLAYAYKKPNEPVMMGLYKEGWNDAGAVTLASGYTQTPHEKLSTNNNVFDRHINEPTNRVLAFHTRHATKGIKTRENTHPFRMENLILAHNGTLTNDYALNNKFFEVDSVAIAHYLDQEQNTPQGLVDKVRGAYALMWLDFRGGSLNFLRNKERPLVFAENDDMVIWASTASVIGALAAEYNLDLQEVVGLPEYTHLKFDIATGARSAVKLTPPVITTHYAGWYGNMGDDYDIYGDAKPAGKEAAQKPANFPHQNANAGAKKPEEEADVLTNLSTAIPGTPAWFQHILRAGKAKQGEGSIRAISRNKYLPSVARRVEMGLEYIRSREFVMKSATTPHLTTGTTLVFSVFGSEVLEYDINRGMVTVTASPAVALRSDLRIVAEVPEHVYREAVFNGLLVQGTIKSSVIVMDKSSQRSCFDLKMQNVFTLMGFDPSIQGLRYHDTGRLVNPPTIDMDSELEGCGLGSC